LALLKLFKHGVSLESSRDDSIGVKVFVSAANYACLKYQLLARICMNLRPVAAPKGC
jgi:hypothetical protein